MTRRFFDRGAVVAAYVGLGMAVTMAISFLLVIPIGPVYVLLSVPGGMIIGYYANARSARQRGEWRRILPNASLAGAVTAITLAILLLGTKALFFYGDSGFNRVDAHGIAVTTPCTSGADCVYSRYMASNPKELADAGVTDAASFEHVYWDEQWSTAELLLGLTTGAALFGGVLFGIAGPRRERIKARAGQAISGAPALVDLGRPIGERRQTPAFEDRALEDLAAMFSSDPTKPTPGVELLDKSQLDYSVESLGCVDDYLEEMTRRSLTDEESSVVVLRAGAYVGEVIRRNSIRPEYHWLDYETAVRTDSRLTSFGGKSIELAAVLWDGESGFTFPLGKVSKFLQNGREDSTRFFAAATLAMRGTSSAAS